MHPNQKWQSASCDEIVSKVKEIVKRYAMYTLSDKTNVFFCISLSRVYYTVKNILNVRKISAKWVPHLFIDGQTKQRVKIAKQMLKILPNFDEKKFANVVNGDETWVLILNLLGRLAIKYGPPTAKDQ